MELRQKAKFNPSTRLLVPLKSTKTSFLKSCGKSMAQQGAEPEGYGATPPTSPSFGKSKYPVQPLPFSLLSFTSPDFEGIWLSSSVSASLSLFFSSLYKFTPSRKRKPILIQLPLPFPCRWKAGLRSCADPYSKRLFPCPVLKSVQKGANLEKKKKSAC